MRATHSIESLLGSRSRVRVLRVLRGVRVPLNASQIAVRARLSQPAVTTVLRELGSMEIVASSPAGRAWVHWLVRDNIYVERVIEPLFAAEETMPDLLTKDLQDAFGDVTVAIVLFGSYARGDQDDTSDIDVVLVAKDSEMKTATEEAVEAESSELRRRYGVTLSPLVYDMDEAATLWQRSPSLFASIERDAVVVCGLAPAEWRHLDREG
jgi:predicted nucleotidyltransferase